MGLRDRAKEMREKAEGDSKPDIKSETQPTPAESIDRVPPIEEPVQPVGKEAMAPGEDIQSLEKALIKKEKELEELRIECEGEKLQIEDKMKELEEKERDLETRMKEFEKGKAGSEDLSKELNTKMKSTPSIKLSPAWIRGSLPSISRMCN